MAPKSVIVIGGGVAGLSAAHELVERGFVVDVFEPRATFGGKARSQPVPGTGTNGRKDLPGEHGFRFYPRFYRHVTDTMARIPFPGGGNVADRLRATTESAIAMVDEATWFRFRRRRLSRPYDIVEAMELFFQTLDFDQADIAVFIAKILQFLTSSDERRLGEYERMSWWQFLDGDRYSPKFQRQLRAVPRTMVAMDPQRGSARTIGVVSMQLILDYATSGVANDRTLGGPTTEIWIDPWLAYLKQHGARLHAGRGVTALEVEGKTIARVRLADDTTATADYYVLAVPLEAAVPLISPALAAVDPTLGRIRTADVDGLLSWMVGIQFFLYEDVPLVRGHAFYPDSPWGLTSISQPQFWRDLGLFRRRYGAGDVGGLISVDISDFETPGIFVKKPARECTPEEIAREVWQQLASALNSDVPGEEVLRDELLHSWHLDDELDFSAGLPATNHSRLLVHPPGSWEVRPEAQTAIGNLVLAADYVRTSTDLATMEGANEAARRAVNAILEHAGSTTPRVGVWPLEEPAWLAPWKRLDAKLYRSGRGHLFELLGIRRVAQFADVTRKLATYLGLDRFDDFLDTVRATAVVKALLLRLGIGDDASDLE
jgi:15-cis-phytoene desaturase